MKIKKLFCGIMIIPILFLSGCWSAHELNAIAVSVALGIDKTGDGYRITEQIVNPKVVASDKATDEAPVILYSAEGKSIEETIKSLSAESPRMIYSYHLRMVILGEDVAREGIEGILDYFVRNHDYRSDFYFAVAKGVSAKEVLSILTAVEAIPGVEMYTTLKHSSKEWAPTKETKLVALINEIVAGGINPVISGVEITEGESATTSTDDLHDSSRLKKLAFNSLAAFDKGRMVGWLDEEESKGYNFIAGNVKTTSIYLRNAENLGITLIISDAEPKIKATVNEGKPSIELSHKLRYRVSHVEGDFDITKKENIELVSKLLEEQNKEVLKRTIEKAQKELKSDIFGFGEKIHKEDPEYFREVESNWNEEFTKLPVNITVKAEMLAIGEISKSYFYKEK